MNGWKMWFFAGYMVGQALMSVCRIGRERPTVTPGMAAVGLVELGFITWLVLS